MVSRSPIPLWPVTVLLLVTRPLGEEVEFEELPEGALVQHSRKTGVTSG
jgi:hypothetical protein